MLKSNHSLPGRMLAGGFVGLLILGIALTGCAQGNQDSPPEGEAIAKEEAVLVKAAPAAKLRFADTIQISGNAVPHEEADISAKIGGDIYQLKGEVGDAVRPGQVLARIDDTRYALAREKAGLGLSSAELTLEQQRVDLERYKALYEQKAISQKEFEAVSNAYKMTEIAMKSAQADLRSADINLRDTTVTSPITGILSKRMVNAGESVNPGTPLFSVVDLSKVSISSGVAESIVNQLQQGMKVKVVFESLGMNVYEGTITHISPVQDQAKLYPIKILVENPEGKIRAGMFATGEVALSEGVEGLAVPKEAVLHEQGRDYVFVAAGDRAVRREVTVGLGDAKHFEIRNGISEGDQVVIVGHEKLKDGALIKVDQ